MRKSWREWVRLTKSILRNFGLFGMKFIFLEQEAKSFQKILVYFSFSKRQASSNLVAFTICRSLGDFIHRKNKFQISSHWFKTFFCRIPNVLRGTKSRFSTKLFQSQKINLKLIKLEKNRFYTLGELFEKQSLKTKNNHCSEI